MQYKDTISTSAPNTAANHTLSFQVLTDVPAEGYVVLTPPEGFTVISDPAFSELRNVELLVNGTPRTVGPVPSLSDDAVEITPGTPGQIIYRLNQTDMIEAGSQVEFRIGNHTSLSQVFSEEYSTSTGTTTTEADIKPIINATTTGSHTLDMRIYDSADVEVANAGFMIALIERVGVGPVDTTEEVPPLRFNGLPTGELSGTTLNVEISVETDEFARCRYSLIAGVDYYSMGTEFANTGLIFHSDVVAVTPGTSYNFYVRCIDDEDNYNIDDYVVSFTVNERPSGESNTEGENNGDGSGTGNSGSGGSGSGNGGSGTSNGSGGSGGGGGGGSGGGSGSSGGGGFESSDGPYRSGDGQVIITGYASPRAKITVLVDGKEAETATADNSGSFSVTIDQIARGAYTFGIYATDAAGTKTSTFSTSFTVSGARTSELSNINVPPSIKATPDPVNPGQTLTLSGYTLPNATVALENEKDKSPQSRKALTAVAGSNGAWSVTVDTNGFSAGTYKVRGKATASARSTNFSQYVLYGVGQSANRGSSSDLNTDGRVNLTDFSILLFWWNTAGGNSQPPADISQDGRVNLTDFSILLFNWSG